MAVATAKSTLEIGPPIGLRLINSNSISRIALSTIGLLFTFLVRPTSRDIRWSSSFGSFLMALNPGQGSVLTTVGGGAVNGQYSTNNCISESLSSVPIYIYKKMFYIHFNLLPVQQEFNHTMSISSSLPLRKNSNFRTCFDF